MSTYIREQSDWEEKWTNFSLNEFKCKCGCDRVEIHADLLDLLQTARNLIGPIQINSAYRCPTYNAKVSSTGESGPHTTGLACDIHVSDSQHRKLLVTFFAPRVYGLGIAKTFLHIDLLSNKEGFDMRPNCWLY